MKTNVLLAASILVLFFGCEKNTTSITSVEPISIQEANDLLFLREEEKLARDVYLYAFEKYDFSVFSNIANSEQTHMDKVLDIIEMYGLEDPALTENGKFSNLDLQELYDNLISKVNLSLTDALLVGATIEDLDIYDLYEYMDNTDNLIILNVYGGLQCGSRNHLRSFTDQLALYETTYTSQYLTFEEVNEIINDDRERCGN